MASEFLTAFDSSGLEIINRKLETFDLQQKQIAILKNSIKGLQANVNSLQNQKQSVGSNNLVLSWSGPTLKVSWPAAFVISRAGVTYHIAAGEVAVAASTSYWFAWNITQYTMSFNQSLQALDNLPNLIVICRITTGTSGQSGVAGGGGSDPGATGAIGKEYSASY